eukprot:TRINITY_DN9738_c0_g2_i2.p1 TRINITY_DN9738_c0_g2~~TRINITY_DN9738_c0_g2_i2.p1  ORF type:complete len:268 (+),score=13.26 TRINITY_DN9738_c0_g2_i2:274-1077(+)
MSQQDSNFPHDDADERYHSPSPEPSATHLPEIPLPPHQVPPHEMPDTTHSSLTSSAPFPSSQIPLQMMQPFPHPGLHPNGMMPLQYQMLPNVAQLTYMLQHQQQQLHMLQQSQALQQLQQAQATAAAEERAEKNSKRAKRTDRSDRPRLSAEAKSSQLCNSCAATTTPQWRHIRVPQEAVAHADETATDEGAVTSSRSPSRASASEGFITVCNACALRYRKKRRICIKCKFVPGSTHKGDSCPKEGCQGLLVVGEATSTASSYHGVA